LITGAGGSIGSALAHEIAKHGPRHIALLDASEQSLYRIDGALGGLHCAVLGSVCDRDLVDEVLERHRPQIVFHAAAFKHVPLAEGNPIATVQNNAVGTFILAQSAAKYRVEQMVTISTDKAVEPAGIMGASKRIAELVMLAMESDATCFKAVRLGNVIASEGSVLPLFQRQMDRGEPLSVTHPDASRYFLTMRHAVGLLLLALSEECVSGVLVPELGEPIRIEKIARRMLESCESSRQSGIVFTGLRPGDKLSEKLVSDRERFRSDRTAALRAIESPCLTWRELQPSIHELELATQERDLPRLLHVVSGLVPDYTPGNVIKSALEDHSAVRSGR
jgi:FlaA1/EpsC-like NDP-sugar epimerase